jgi:hypothetical protein
LLPVVGFGLKGFAARFGEVVEASAAIVIRGAPFGFDGAFLFEFEEDRVERALIDGEEVAADLFDAAGKAVAVEGAEDVESLEDHKGESALEDVGFFGDGRGRHLGIQQKDDMGPLGKQQGSWSGVGNDDGWVGACANEIARRKRKQIPRFARNDTIFLLGADGASVFWKERQNPHPLKTEGAAPRSRRAEIEDRAKR